MKKATSEFVITLKTIDYLDDGVSTYTKERAINKLKSFLENTISNENTEIKVECIIYEIIEVNE